MASVGARVVADLDITRLIFDELLDFAAVEHGNNRGSIVRPYLLVSKTWTALLTRLRDEKISFGYTEESEANSKSGAKQQRVYLLSKWANLRPHGIGAYFAGNVKAREAVRSVTWTVLEHDIGACSASVQGVAPAECKACSMALQEVAGFLTALPGVQHASIHLPSVNRSHDGPFDGDFVRMPSQIAFDSSFALFGSRLRSLELVNANNDTLSALLFHMPQLQRLVLFDYLFWGEPDLIGTLQLKELDMHVLHRDKEQAVHESREWAMQSLALEIVAQRDDWDWNGSDHAPLAEQEQAELQLLQSGLLCRSPGLFWPWLLGASGSTLRKLSLGQGCLFSGPNGVHSFLPGAELPLLEDLTLALPSESSGSASGTGFIEWPACTKRLSLIRSIPYQTLDDTVSFQDLADYVRRCGTQQVVLTFARPRSKAASYILREACRFFRHFEPLAFEVRLEVRWQIHASRPAAVFHDSTAMLSWALDCGWISDYRRDTRDDLAAAPLVLASNGYIHRESDIADMMRIAKKSETEAAVTILSCVPGHADYQWPRGLDGDYLDDHVSPLAKPAPEPQPPSLPAQVQSTSWRNPGWSVQDSTVYINHGQFPSS